MSVATFISRILGYVKDMILAFYFGASSISDSFFAAFRIINFSRELFAEGSMSAAYIPTLTEHRLQKGEEEAKKLVKITFSFILVVVGIVCILGIIFAPAIVKVITPGFFEKSPEKVPLTILLTRVMFPFLLFISLAALVMGALNTKRVFFIPALAPALLNVTIIVMIVSFISFFDQPIIAVALGVVIGGFVQFAFQVPSFYKNGYRFGFLPHFRHPGLKKMAILLIPVTLTLAVNQINLLVGTFFASFIPQGITYLYYSMRLMQFPLGIFAVSMGMAALPMLSEHAVKGDFDKLREDFSFSLRLLFYVSVPAMAGLIALREPIVNLLFQRGTFDYTATQATAEALMFYSLGIWATGGVRIMSVTFYSMKDTKTPVKTNALGVVVNIIFCYLLYEPLKHSGIALAYALAFSVNFILLFLFIRKKLEKIDTGKIFRSFIKTCIAAGIMGLIGASILRGNLWQLSGNTVVKVLYLSGTIALCVGAYFFLTYLLKSEECLYIIDLAKKKLRR
jgi:putative peptidoglycan lipid II flippase